MRLPITTEDVMRILRTTLAAAALTVASVAAAPAPHAQISVGIGIGAAPVCPYGYYGYAPYNCAPYGYYGPEWFTNGVFLGAGPWYHGRPGFYGHVDRRFDPRYGYHGPYPRHEEHFDNRRDFHEFHGRDMGGVHGEFRGGHR
jgi:hypothetical protein